MATNQAIVRNTLEPNVTSKALFNVIYVHLMFAGWLAGWIAGWTAGWFLSPSPISPACQRFDWGCFRYCTLLTLMVAQCTSHALRLKTQPGIFLELDEETGETEHSRSDRQLPSLTYDTVISRKPVAVKNSEELMLLRNIAAKIYSPSSLQTTGVH